MLTKSARWMVASIFNIYSILIRVWAILWHQAKSYTRLGWLSCVSLSQCVWGYRRQGGEDVEPTASWPYPLLPHSPLQNGHRLNTIEIMWVTNILTLWLEKHVHLDILRNWLESIGQHGNNLLKRRSHIRIHIPATQHDGVARHKARSYLKYRICFINNNPFLLHIL